MYDDVDACTTQKVNELRQKYPDISIDGIVRDSEYGKWSVILYVDYDFTVMGIEFIESETSWKRPEAFDEYDSVAKDGYCIVIYAPSTVLDDVAKMLRANGAGPNFRLYSTDKCLESSRDRMKKEVILSPTY